ncbi:homoserine dehydrogenase [Nisaea nitritireducens]|uniref:homoserine dehydrogenase n=1 Tax=Nisaea nitritireducens TaxID=568392 RepID=UPI001868E1A6|nr:homoserine dehydrogenase [Nisaea nitritireducens]
MQPFRVAIAGLGTVGAETARILLTDSEMLSARAGRPIELKAISARDKSRDRGIDLSGVDWVDDAAALAGRDDVDCVLELIGGSEGVAYDLVLGAIKSGKSVVTANKALIAHHGSEIAKDCEEKGVGLGFEAAVAGGIPIIKSLREGLAGNHIKRVYGILNGTCNYIMSVMRETGRPFDDVLADAQRLGYAEADPSFDVDGVDAAHKLAILSAIAFGHHVDFENVHVEGVRHVSPLDITFAEELGYRIKLLGIAEETDAGVQQRVHPCMVKAETPIGQVEDVFNAVVAEGSAVGTTLSYGRGAGAGPTASAVIADVMDLAAGRRVPVFGLDSSKLSPARTAPISSLTGCYYLRLMVIDRPGVLADVTAVFRDHEVSIEAMIQRARNPEEAVPLVLTTHETSELAIKASFEELARLDCVLEEPRQIRIEDF